MAQNVARRVKEGAAAHNRVNQLALKTRDIMPLNNKNLS